jgi:hypothetical protein
MLRRGVLEIADKYIQYFLLSDGARRQAVDVNTGQPTAHNATSFHIYNDDFAGLGLLAAYKETKNEKYLDASTRQGRWLAARTEESGRLGGISSAPATAMVHFLAHRKITGTTEFDEPMRRYAHYLMSQQVTKIARSDFAGGICGQSHVNAADESGQYIDGRTTSYAICALLGFANPNERMFLDVE